MVCDFCGSTSRVSECPRCHLDLCWRHMMEHICHPPDENGNGDDENGDNGEEQRVFA